jgi:hypothetical protein
MPLEGNEILFNPDEGAYLPVLDIAHKATTAVTETRFGIGSGQGARSHALPAKPNRLKAIDCRREQEAEMLQAPATA